MPFVPDEVKVPKPGNLRIEQKDDKIRLLWDYNNGEADFFKIDIAYIECLSCPANYNNIAQVDGDKDYFVFSGYDTGNYRLKITAVRNKTESKPVETDFEIKNEK